MTSPPTGSELDEGLQSKIYCLKDDLITSAVIEATITKKPHGVPLYAVAHIAKSRLVISICEQECSAMRSIHILLQGLAMRIAATRLRR
jgi:hypothetical protein